jgi:hypothetical protein
VFWWGFNCSYICRQIEKCEKQSVMMWNRRNDIDCVMEGFCYYGDEYWDCVMEGFCYGDEYWWSTGASWLKRTHGKYAMEIELTSTKNASDIPNTLQWCQSTISIKFIFNYSRCNPSSYTLSAILQELDRRRCILLHYRQFARCSSLKLISISQYNVFYPSRHI